MSPKRKSPDYANSRSHNQSTSICIAIKPQPVVGYKPSNHGSRPPYRMRGHGY